MHCSTWSFSLTRRPPPTTPPASWQGFSLASDEEGMRFGILCNFMIRMHIRYAVYPVFSNNSTGWPICSVKASCWLGSNNSIAAYRPGRMAEHPKSNRRLLPSRWVTLYHDGPPHGKTPVIIAFEAGNKRRLQNCGIFSLPFHCHTHATYQRFHLLLDQPQTPSWRMSFMSGFFDKFRVGSSNMQRIMQQNSIPSWGHHVKMMMPRMMSSFLLPSSPWAPRGTPPSCRPTSSAPGASRPRGSCLKIKQGYRLENLNLWKHVFHNRNWWWCSAKIWVISMCLPSLSLIPPRHRSPHSICNDIPLIMLWNAIRRQEDIPPLHSILFVVCIQRLHTVVLKYFKYLF